MMIFAAEEERKLYELELARGWARSLAYPLEFASEDDGTAPEMHEDAFVPGWVQGPLAAPGATLHLVLSPEEPEVYWGLAESARHLGNFADARANYLKVVEYDPGSRHAKDAAKLLKTPEIANAQAASTTQPAPATPK